VVRLQLRITIQYSQFERSQLEVSCVGANRNRGRIINHVEGQLPYRGSFFLPRSLYPKTRICVLLLLMLLPLLVLLSNVRIAHANPFVKTLPATPGDTVATLYAELGPNGQDTWWVILMHDQVTAATWVPVGCTGEKAGNVGNQFVSCLAEGLTPNHYYGDMIWACWGPDPLGTCPSPVDGGEVSWATLPTQPLYVEAGDYVVWRPSAGYWFIQHTPPYSGNYPTWTEGWGTNGDVPLLGSISVSNNVAPHEVKDIVIWRPSSGTWFVLQYSTSYYTNQGLMVQWGTNGDIPLLGDFDGDGHDDFIIWRPSTGAWFILKSSSGYNPASASVILWGTNGDKPLVGDVDGDRKADLCVWRPSGGHFFCLLSSTNYSPGQAMIKQWGSGTLNDVPFIADMDLAIDRKADFIIWRPGTGTWFMLLSWMNYDPAQARLVQWGISTDTPMAATGAICAWRNGVWFVLYGPSFTSAEIASWGTNGDVVVFSGWSPY
jgi:hypothetical protein